GGSLDVWQGAVERVALGIPVDEQKVAREQVERGSDALLEPLRPPWQAGQVSPRRLNGAVLVQVLPEEPRQEGHQGTVGAAVGYERVPQLPHASSPPKGSSGWRSARSRTRGGRGALPLDRPPS